MVVCDGALPAVSNAARSPLGACRAPSHPANTTATTISPYFSFPLPFSRPPLAPAGGLAASHWLLAAHSSPLVRSHSPSSIFGTGGTAEDFSLLPEELLTLHDDVVMNGAAPQQQGGAVALDGPLGYKDGFDTYMLPWGDVPVPDANEQPGSAPGSSTNASETAEETSGGGSNSSETSTAMTPAYVLDPRCGRP